MDYLVYAYLQEGRDREAGDIVQQITHMRNLDERDFKIAYASTAMPVRYAIERRQWADAAAITPPDGAPAHVVLHVGLSDMPTHSAASHRIGGQSGKGKPDRRNHPTKKPLGTVLHQEASVCISEGDGTRTRNHRIDSPVL